MFKWPNVLRGKNANSGPDREPVESDTSAVVETAIPPRRRWTTGRRLAFAVGKGVIQMVAARHLAGRCEILDVSVEPMLGDSESAARQSDHVSLTIAEYVGRFGGRAPEIDVAINGRETAFRSFLMPALKSSELESAIGFEAQKQIPFPTADCLIDYQRTFEIVDNQRTRYKIALHAAPSRLVKEQLEPFRQKGLEVANVVIADEAIGRLLERLPDFDPNSVYTWLEVGPDDSKIAYYRGSALEFTHTGSTGMSKLGGHPDISLLEFFVESLAREISISQDYYSGQYAGVLPNRILISGELAGRTELLELFNGKTSFQFVPFPLDAVGMLTGIQPEQEKLANACLAALATATTRYRLCNLLPRDIRRAQSLRTVGRYGRLALALVAITLFVGWAQLRMSVDSIARSTEVIEQQVALTSQSDAYLKHRSLIQQIAFDRAYMNKTKASTGNFNLTLKELSILTPTEVKLNRLEYAPGLLEEMQNLVLHGKVATPNIPPEMILAQYVERLKASGLFYNVELVRHVKRKVRDTFVIDFQIEMQGVA